MTGLLLALLLSADGLYLAPGVQTIIPCDPKDKTCPPCCCKKKEGDQVVIFCPGPFPGARCSGGLGVPYKDLPACEPPRVAWGKVGGGG